MYLRMIRAAFEKAAPKAGFRKSHTQTLERLKPLSSRIIYTIYDEIF